MATTYLNRTLSGSGNKDKWTFSCWVKRHNTGVIHPLFHADDGSSNYYTHISFHDTDQLFFQNRWNNGNDGYKITTRMFRDTNAWYHLQFVWDSGNATADDRQIIYVNGERLTLFGGANVAVTQNRNSTINDGYEHRIGRGGTFNGSAYADVTMSHVHFTDGYAYAPTVFGETDSTTGEWKIKTSPSMTMGTNGFTVLKDGNTITDQSSNSNNFTLAGGTLSNTKDCPSNVFCTLNPLYNQTSSQGVPLTKLNTRCEYTSNSSRGAYGTIAPSSGKYYFECKPYNNSLMVVGIVNMAWPNINGASGYAFHDHALNFGYNVQGEKTSGGTNTSYGAAVSNNDIVQVAMDLDNSKLYFGVNGTWQNSGDPTSGSTGTGSAFNLASGANYTAACRLRNGTDLDFNFGNGTFRGTAVSSAGTNASGHGVFEYDVPTGYTALCTKGLNE